MLNDAMEQTIIKPTYEDCMEALYNEYGDNFVPIRKDTVFVRGGFLGLSQKSAIKVSYYVKNSEIYQKPEPVVRQATPIVSNPNAEVTNEKIDEMKKQIEDLTHKVSLFATTMIQPDKHESIKRIESILQENEFTPSFIEDISNRMRSDFTSKELDDFDLVEHRVIDWIGQRIHIAQEGYFKAPHIIVIVGPTGVGKTTTVAKMGAGVILEARKNGKEDPLVRMVTTDITRVGAEEQLKTYGDLMNVGVDKAENPEALQKIFEEYKDTVDTLLVDTSGYSPNDYSSIAKMRELLNVQGMKPDVYLAVSASTKARDLENIIRSYEMFEFRSVIITKFDETTRYGNFLSVLAEKNKSISYITDGQQVPRYIRKATVVDFLKNLADFKVDRAHIDDLFRS